MQSHSHVTTRFILNRYYEPHQNVLTSRLTSRIFDKPSLHLVIDNHGKMPFLSLEQPPFGAPSNAIFDSRRRRRERKFTRPTRIIELVTRKRRAGINPRDRKFRFGDEPPRRGRRFQFSACRAASEKSLRGFMYRGSTRHGGDR